MARLPDLDPAKLTAEQKPVYDTIVAGPRGGLRGPLAIWLRRPPLADRAQALGAYCRFDSSLPKRLSELAILVTARAWTSAFEWWAHAPLAAQAGVKPEIIEAIRTGATPLFAAADEEAVYLVARALQHERRLSNELYAKGIAVLGEAGMVDLIGVLGYYCLVSMTLNAFDVETPPGTPPVFA